MRIVLEVVLSEAFMREEFDALVADGYSQSWEGYRREQVEALRTYASGWLENGEATFEAREEPSP